MRLSAFSPLMWCTTSPRLRGSTQVVRHNEPVFLDVEPVIARHGLAEYVIGRGAHIDVPAADVTTALP